MNTLNRILRITFLGLTTLLIAPAISQAMPESLACKLYNQQGGMQMRSQLITQNGTTKTYLIFDRKVAYYPISHFELIYSSGYDRQQPLFLVARATAENGISQTVEIRLAAPTQGEPTTRYGTVKAGDTNYNWYSTMGKYNRYNIQCYNL